MSAGQSESPNVTVTIIVRGDSVQVDTDNATPVPPSQDTPEVIVDEPLLYSVSDLATRTGLSESTIRRRVRSGQLPARRLGDLLVFRPEDVRDWIAGLPTVVVEEEI